MTIANEKTERSAKYLADTEIHEEWDRNYLNEDLDRFYNAAFARLIAALGAEKGDRILDAGCGYCFHAARLAEAGLKVTGVDLSPAALAQARNFLDKRGLPIELKQGNLLDLPFADGSFPYLNCWGVLMHIPELEKALLELARVLEPGGRLAISENNMRSFHVSVWEEAVLRIKKLLGRQLPRRDRTVRGIEEWREEGLMIRKLDMDWVVNFYSKHGLSLVERFAGQYTELYTNLPTRGLKRLVYRFNEKWFQERRSPELALNNVLIFEKSR